MKPTPTKNRLPLRKGSFTTLADALDYAAEGDTGFNFYDGVGKLGTVLPYKILRKEARSLARRCTSASKCQTSGFPGARRQRLDRLSRASG